jgi:hypothetical protein
MMNIPADISDRTMAASTLYFWCEAGRLGCVSCLGGGLAARKQVGMGTASGVGDGLLTCCLGDLVNKMQFTSTSGVAVLCGLYDKVLPLLHIRQPEEVINQADALQ